MRSHSLWGKLTAMVLALMLVLPGSFVAFAEGNETVIIGDVSESVGVYADEYTGDSSLTVNGNVTISPDENEWWITGVSAGADGGAEAAVTVNGTVTVESGSGANGVHVSVNDGGVAEVSVGDISVNAVESANAVSVYSYDGAVTLEAGQLNAESSGEKDWDGASGLNIQTESENAAVDVTVGDIQADSGIGVSNQGGEITVSAGSIEAAD